LRLVVYFVVKIELMVWERGKNWPFPWPKQECAECSIEKSILEDMKNKEFKNKKIKIEVKPFFEFSNLFYTLFRGGYHPPVLIVNGKKFHQFSENEKLFNRKKLAESVMSK